MNGNVLGSKTSLQWRKLREILGGGDEIFNMYAFGGRLR